MAIKIICDICGKEPNDPDFCFEATIMEIRTSLAGQALSPKKEIRKELIQICRECFEKHISKLLKNKKFYSSSIEK